MLEAAQYENCTFATLTYDDENYPEDHSVKPGELSAFFKRLRFATGLKLRYFGVGEYGDQSGRPHYHVAIFGYPNCLYGVTRKREKCCSSCEGISKAWGKGNIFLGELTANSAQYVAGYTVKKMTDNKDPRLEGRLPEFARMSLRPGIGLGMMHELASTLMEHRLDERMIDVPTTLQHGTKKFPLGRYLRRKLRTFIGRPEACPEAAIQQQKEDMRDVRESAFRASTPLKNAVLEQSLGKRIQIQNRQRTFKKRGQL